MMVDALLTGSVLHPPSLGSRLAAVTAMVGDKALQWAGFLVLVIVAAVGASSLCILLLALALGYSILHHVFGVELILPSVA